jgi:hypothetical protein
MHPPQLLQLQAISPFWRTIHLGQQASTMIPTSIAAPPIRGKSRPKQSFLCQIRADKGHLRTLKSTSNLVNLIFFKHLTGKNTPLPSPPPHSGCANVPKRELRSGSLCVSFQAVVGKSVRAANSLTHVLRLTEEQAQ